jgi:ATP adenylyltransferase
MARSRTPRRARPEAASGPARLWAPWRAAYLRTAAAPARGCIFCFGALGARERRRRLVLYAGPLALVMLNRYPYNNGHLLVAPFRHEGKLEALTSEELAEVMAITIEAKKLLDRTVCAHGYNIGVNLGRAAGAGLEEHFHLHIVPRWSGDTNFVTTIGSTKVIPQALEELWQLLHSEWNKAAPEGKKC